MSAEQPTLNPAPPSNNEDELEGEIEELLISLPSELATTWDAKNADKTSSERKSNLEELIHSRKKSLTSKSTSGNSLEDIPVLEAQPLAIQKIVENIAKGRHEDLGQGKAGRVIASERLPNDICYKIMFPSDQVPPETNDIATEASIQDSIHELGEMFGVKVPEVFYFIQNGTTRAIAMERFDAITLHDMLSGKEAVPELFDADVFYKSLSSYLQSIHEKGYYHRDLHDRNVMIDKKTGMPRVIDFGSSTHTDFPDDVYRESAIRYGQSISIVLPSDIGSLEKIRLQVQEVTYSKGVRS